MSQNIATMDEPPFLTERTLGRWSDEQKALFPATSLLRRDDSQVLLSSAVAKL
jgi:hypothetical protein